ncbi:hypothetical protein Tco_0472013 [Tanacetum coccineum]
MSDSIGGLVSLDDEIFSEGKESQELNIDGGLEGDEERLCDELYKLETIFGVLAWSCDVAAKKERQRGDVANFCTKNEEDI